MDQKCVDIHCTQMSNIPNYLCNITVLFPFSYNRVRDSATQNNSAFVFHNEGHTNSEVHICYRVCWI